MWQNFLIWLKTLFNMYQITVSTDEDSFTATVRKKPDTTKFTKQHHDIIMDEYHMMQVHNKGVTQEKRINTDELTDLLNQRFGLDKSRTSYSRVWTGKIVRDNLEDSPNTIL